MILDIKNVLNVYEFKCVLPGSGKEVNFKPITTKQMKKLLIYENETDPEIIEKALDELISSCVIDKDFNVSSLYEQDRFFLLLELRKKSKGETYKFQINCPKCKSQSIQVIDLTKLETKVFKQNDNLIKINDRLGIKLQHITRKIKMQAYDIINGMQINNENKKNVEASLLTIGLAIKSIIMDDIEYFEGDISLENRLDIIEALTQEQYDLIQDWFKENDFGTILKYRVKCPFCTFNKEEDIPLDNFFF